MTTKTHRTIVNLPGRMESHSVRGARSHLPRSMEVLAASEREPAIGDPLHLEDVEALEQPDEETSRLQLAFMRAYGAPSDEFTVVAGPSAGVGNGACGRRALSPSSERAS